MYNVYVNCICLTYQDTNIKDNDFKHNSFVFFLTKLDVLPAQLLENMYVYFCHSTDKITNEFQVVDILRVTELYSSHLKTENIKYDDPVTSDLIGALITVNLLIFFFFVKNCIQDLEYLRI